MNRLDVGDERGKIMSVLYVIGNGFDLHFGLKTSPQDFQDILTKKQIYNETDNAYDVLHTYGVNWSEYEQSLAEIDLDEIEDQNIIGPDYSSDHEFDRYGGIVNMQMYVDSINEAISSALSDMVQAANEEVGERNSLGERYQLFNPEDAILSFNYTSSGINKIVVLGHSMGQVDSDYMEQIERTIHPDEWEIYFHDSNDVKVNSNNYSFVHKIHFSEW